MQAYILSIAGIILISAVVSILSPSGKMGKFVKGMVKLMSLVVLVSPFVSLFRGDGLTFSSAKIDSDEDYVSTCVALMERADEKEIAALLQAEYSVEGEATVARENDSAFSVKNIKIKITDFGISPEEEHIYIMDRIKTALQNRYVCDVEVTAWSG